MLLSLTFSGLDLEVITSQHSSADGNSAPATAIIVDSSPTIPAQLFGSITTNWARVRRTMALSNRSVIGEISVPQMTWKILEKSLDVKRFILRKFCKFQLQKGPIQRISSTTTPHYLFLFVGKPGHESFGKFLRISE